MDFQDLYIQGNALESQSNILQCSNEGEELLEALDGHNPPGNLGHLHTAPTLSNDDASEKDPQKVLQEFARKNSNLSTKKLTAIRKRA